MNRLKHLRLKHNLTQEELGKKINQSKSNISKYENNILEPNNQTLLLLSEFFHVSTDYLLGRTDDPTPYRDVDSDLDSSPDEELKQLLNDPELRVAFMDYSSWTDEDKRELINFIKFKKSQREMKENK